MRQVLIALAAASLAGTAIADSIARQGSNWVRLTLRPCEDAKVAAVIQAQGKHPGQFRAAYASFDGRSYVACWTPAQGGAALVYQDADVGFVPIGDLKPAPEA